MGVKVVVIITPAPGKGARMAELLVWLNGHFRNDEPGMVKHQMFREVEDDGENENIFVTIEEYADEAAYQAHSQTKHFGEAYKAATDESLFGAPLRFIKIEPLAGTQNIG